MTFAERFDSFYPAIQSQNSYLEAKGYRAEGDRALWQPIDFTDLEPETTNYGPGAAAAGELLDDVYLDNDEPNLEYEDFDADWFIESEEF